MNGTLIPPRLAEVVTRLIEAEFAERIVFRFPIMSDAEHKAAIRRMWEQLENEPSGVREDFEKSFGVRFTE